jgi:hypothetical protein
MNYNPPLPPVSSVGPTVVPTRTDLSEACLPCTMLGSGPALYHARFRACPALVQDRLPARRQGAGTQGVGDLGYCSRHGR